MTKRILMMAVVVGTLFSCEEDVDPNKVDDVIDSLEDVTNNPSSCKLMKVESTDDDNDKSTWTYTYDNDGNLTQWEDVYSSSDGDVYTEGLKFTYSSMLPVTASYYDLDYPDDAFDIDIDWSGSDLTKVSFSYEEDGQEATWELKFLYSGGKLNKVEAWSNEYYDENTEEVTIGDLYIDEVYEITFTGENISKIVSTDYEDGSTSELSYTETITYSGYDSKINPFRGDIATLLWDDNWAGFFSANNVGSVTDVEKAYEDGTVTEEWEESYDYTYTYNDKDLPTTIKEVEMWDGSTYTTDLTLTYDCN
ncbi:MAG: hypothetical protein JXR10_04820 [Cyclobacteriaceae bacterium]